MQTEPTHPSRSTLATISAILFGALALFFGLALLGMIGAYVSGAEKQASAAEILIATGITLAFAWLTRKCWRKKHSAPSASAGPTPIKPLINTKSSKPPIKEYTEFYSKIYGTSHRNRDGTSRQSAIRKDCYPGAWLDLVREPDNKHDKNAIAAFYNEKQIGYLSAEIADKYASKIDQNLLTISAYIEDITGGDSDAKTLGVNITIRITET